MLNIEMVEPNLIMNHLLANCMSFELSFKMIVPT